MGKQFKNVAMMACLKTLLMVFNFVFWFSGMAMLALGLWAEVELYKYLELSSDFSGTAPYVLIGIGAFVVFISSLACTCTIKGQAVLLYIYGGFLAVIFVMELGVGISGYTYRSKLAEGFDKGLNQSINNYNTGVGKSADFELMQTTFHCCGVHKYTDWMKLQPPKVVPLSCCKIPTSCVTSNPDDIYQRGCFRVVVDFLDYNMRNVAYLAISIALFPLLGTLISCLLAKEIKKAKYTAIT